MVLKWSKRRVHPLLKKILDPPLALTAFRYFSEQKAVFFTNLPCVKAVAAARLPHNTLKKKKKFIQITY